MTSSIRIVLAVAVLAVVAAVLNPSAERHREKIRSAVAERSLLQKALGMGELTAFASTYHSIGVASYTTVGERTASVGLLGVVVVLD